MKLITYAMLAFLGCNFALANSNFVSNPRLPYPPSCPHIPAVDASAWLDGQAVKIYENEITLYDLNNSGWQPVPLTLRVYRSPCSEPDRSLIWLRFSMSGSDADRGVKIELPGVAAVDEINWRRSMQLVSQPNGWGVGDSAEMELTYLISQPYGHPWYYPPASGELNWVFLLDNVPPLDEWWYWHYWLGASAYNEHLTLVLSLAGAGYDFLEIDVPATTELLPMPSPRLPLSGRQSGAWVIEGAADQGFQLVISDQVDIGQESVPGASSRPLVVFFSQYTFDETGEMLWLTGASQFEPGANVVTIPIEKVTNGEFRGSKKAHREIVGSVTITSNSCNDLGFEYDYSSLGLGQGVKRLQRIFSLETAGYDCRDYEARVAANH